MSTLTARLKAKNDALNTEGRDPTVNEVIYDVQEKARTLMATPRDYAKLVAAYHLSSWKETVDLSNGKTRSELRYDYEKRLDGGELNEETERVLKDPDFQYLMKHEKKTVLQLNAVNLYGINFLRYPERVEKMKMIEAQRKESVLSDDQPEKNGKDSQIEEADIEQTL